MMTELTGEHVPMAWFLGFLMGVVVANILHQILDWWRKRLLRRMTPEQRTEWLND